MGLGVIKGCNYVCLWPSSSLVSRSLQKRLKKGWHRGKWAWSCNNVSQGVQVGQGVLWEAKVSKGVPKGGQSVQGGAKVSKGVPKVSKGGPRCPRGGPREGGPRCQRGSQAVLAASCPHLPPPCCSLHFYWHIQNFPTVTSCQYYMYVALPISLRAQVVSSYMTVMFLQIKE